jgi:hypothetical protein
MGVDHKERLRDNGRVLRAREKGVQIKISINPHSGLLQDIRISITSLMCRPFPLVGISMSGTGIPCVYCIEELASKLSNIVRKRTLFELGICGVAKFRLRDGLAES